MIFIILSCITHNFVILFSVFLYSLQVLKVANVSEINQLGSLKMNLEF